MSEGDHLFDHNFEETTDGFFNILFQDGSPMEEGDMLSMPLNSSYEYGNEEGILCNNDEATDFDKPSALFQQLCICYLITFL